MAAVGIIQADRTIIPEANTVAVAGFVLLADTIIDATGCAFRILRLRIDAADSSTLRTEFIDAVLGAFRTCIGRGIAYAVATGRTVITYAFLA